MRPPLDSFVGTTTRPPLDSFVMPVTKPEPQKAGIVGSLVRPLLSVGNLAEQAVSTIGTAIGKGNSEYIRNLDAQIKREQTEGYDLGVFGKARPYGSSGSFADLKDTVGNALNVGSTVASFGAGTAAGIAGKAIQYGGLAATQSVGKGIEDKLSTGDIFKNAMFSGTLGAGLGVVSSKVGDVVNKFVKKAPGKMVNIAIKNPLPDTKKAILYNGKTLGEEIVDRGITGSDKSLFKQAISQIESNETALQNILNKSKETISRDELVPYLQGLINTKNATPGLADDVLKINAVIREFPEQIPIAQANQVKRNLYNALDDVAFRIDPNLSTKKEAMKAIAKGIKTEIEKKTAKQFGEGTVRDINQNLSVFGRLKDRALDKIARASKNNLVGLGDYAAMGTGAIAGMASGGSVAAGAIGAEVLKKTLSSTRVLTNVAQLVKKLPVDKAGRVSRTALLNLITSLNSRQQ